MKPDRVRRLQKLEARMIKRAPSLSFTVIDDQVEVDRLQRQHPDALIIHYRIVAPSQRVQGQR